MTEEQLTRLYGSRCADHCDDCCVCEVWAMFDRIAELEAALREMLHAVCHETGFAAAVRADSGCAYPWPPLDNALKAALAALGDKQ